MKAIITGKNGQLGFELKKTIPDGVEVYAFDSAELDITDSGLVEQKIQEIKPDIIINAAAYTAVDKAETDRDAALKVNGLGVKNLANCAKKNDARLIHVSTDFVFDACKNTWYETHDRTNPLGVYGETKLAGEAAILDCYPENSVIIRTSWVYSSHGNNFVKTMLRLMSEKEELGIVADQVGTPTWARGLAEACWRGALNKTESNIYHWSDLGTASWYDFAVAIQELGIEMGMLKREIPVNPIRASQYPTPAKRPAYSVMDTSEIREELGMDGIHWRKALQKMMTELSQI